ncbi:glycerophosphoryl diester phosphodiesterase membrane domain-containing protein [Lacticaseibacillus porcinae]|uniref:glycerophosphoryl diester phosphodiesterase membrane domain-containing protein n=1 Tax=Lacticaseibacillus porcinae TaxID=1123687 RepID=UPI0013DE74E0|nr:glycerophosphodiester phosphodiesterase [Lacticaseibacillus porcinae]
MKFMRDISGLFKEFGARWGSYLMLMGMVTAITSGVVVPLMRWTTAGILSASDIPYLGVDNLLSIFTQHQLAAFELIVLLLVVLLLVYVQFAILLGGLDNIRRRTGLGVRAVIIEGLRDVRHLKPSGFGFFIVYLLLVMPFAGVIIHTQLLAKVEVPTFVLDWLVTKPLYAVLVFLFYVAMAYLGVRWLRVLPITILRDRSLIVSARESWHETRGKFWAYALRLGVLAIIFVLIGFGWSALLIGIQNVADNTGIAFGVAIVTLTLLIAGQILLSGMSSVIYLLFLIAPDDVEAGRVHFQTDGSHHWLRRAVVLIAGGFGVLIMGAFAGFYMKGALTEAPMTISHRGVDAGNGVQNTIPALEKTAKLKPDYVEMDLHETKDGQFIVLHDENLKALAGVNKTPRELTLAQLQEIIVRENGHHAKLASFSDYLATANALHQKLMVELKPTKADSKDMLQRFIDQYGQQLIKHGDRVHSLSYPLMVTLHQQLPKLPANFIMPFSLVPPQTKLSGYTVEETTLDDAFVDAVHRQHQQVWAWTVNDRDAMTQMVFADVDGIITDNLTELKQVIAEQNDHPSYAQRLEVFATTLSDFGRPVMSN